MHLGISVSRSASEKCPTETKCSGRCFRAGLIPQDDTEAEQRTDSVFQVLGGGMMGHRPVAEKGFREVRNVQGLEGAEQMG